MRASTKAEENEYAHRHEYFGLLHDNQNVLIQWEQLVFQYQAIGKSAHDARLVAAMLVHGVVRLLTFNKADFVRYQSIVVVSPQDVVGPPPTP